MSSSDSEDEGEDEEEYEEEGYGGGVYVTSGAEKVNVEIYSGRQTKITKVFCVFVSHFHSSVVVVSNNVSYLRAITVILNSQQIKL